MHSSSPSSHLTARHILTVLPSGDLPVASRLCLIFSYDTSIFHWFDTNYNFKWVVRMFMKDTQQRGDLTVGENRATLANFVPLCGAFGVRGNVFGGVG